MHLRYVIKVKNKPFKFIAFSTSFFLALFILFSYINHTPEPIIVESLKCMCESGPDSYASPFVFTYGKYKGQCVDNCTYRSTQLSFNPKDYNEKRLVQVSNIFHEGKFWKAYLPITQLESTELLFEKFAWNANHVSIRFIFKDPLLLESQIDLPKYGPSKKVWLNTKSIVFSPEGAPPKNLKYTLYDSFMGRYGLIYRAYSYEKYQEITKNLNHPVKTIALELNAKESQALLITSFTKANSRPIETYQLLFNNCATASIDLILSSKKLILKNNWNMWNFMDPLRGIPTDNSIGTLRSLYWWQLIKEPAVKAPTDTDKS